MEESAGAGKSPISLSHFTKALIDNIKKIKSKSLPDEFSKISVSQTISFFAIAYEKLRNVVEYREEHLIRRAAIERILKRRLALNPEGKEEAEELLRELLWARYFPNESLGKEDRNKTQEIIDKYLYLRKKLLIGQTSKQKNYYSKFLFDLMTCEIEEALSPEESRQTSLFTFFTFQVLKNKVKIEGISEEQKNAYLYVALDRALNKSDLPYLRYHLFSLMHNPVSQLSSSELENVVTQLPSVFRRIDETIGSPFTIRLQRFARLQIPPFRILFELFKKRPHEIERILQDKRFLWNEVEQLCREKYAQSRNRLNSLAIKAIIYIFLTKMIFALLLEYPLSLAIYNEVNFVALAINSLFPPFLMFVIIGLTKVPGEDNTKRLFERLVDITDADKEFETSVSFISKKPKVRKPTLVFGFTVFYALTFIATFVLLYELLSFLQFNLISQAVFVFFVSLITFFSHRIRQIAKEYQLKETESFFRPFIDLFFLPILSLGKFLSRGLAKLNFFTFIFDFLIEAPFKLIIEVFEEWISFVRRKRDEIV